ncbi:MAG: ComEC/Rec2 family competence protein [Candidatus Paceibacterota bacterium]|jgi:ComEC/Rec2-related protein
MHFSRKIFFVLIFFLCGVGLVGVDVGLASAFLIAGAVSCAAFFIAVIFMSRPWGWIAVLVWGVVVGAVYYDARLTQVYAHAPAYQTSITLLGTVVSHPRVSATSQQFIFETDEGARLGVVLTPFQALAHGDRLTLSGSVEPLSSTTRYLIKDQIAGSMAFPSIEKHISAGWSVRGMLYKISDALARVYMRILPPDEASLAAGIVLGQQSASFSASFKDAMRASGTTHVVALSGYNIMIVIGAVSFLLSFLFGRRGRFWGSCAIVVVFVLMTGAESSVVRAALMGILVLAAQYASRLYDFWHSAAVVAFFMILWNPFALLFDLGFVLSFLSLFGIMVLAPRLAALMPVNKTRYPIAGDVRDIVAQTIGAQLAVLPILIGAFSGFSWMSVAANVPILLVMPLAMGLVFVVGCVGLIWVPAASLLAIVPHAVLWLQTRLITFFGSFPLQAVIFPWYVVVLYYGALSILFHMLPSHELETNIDYV